MKRAGIALLVLLLMAAITWRWKHPIATGTVEQPRAMRAPRTELPLRVAPPTIEVEAEIASFEGRVVDARSGAAVPRAQISFLHEGTAVSVSGGSDGNFRLVLPEPGRYVLESLSAPGYLPYSSALGEIVLVARPRMRVRDLELYLEPRVECLGHVVDPQGKPAAGAHVSVEEETLTAGAQGEFHFACRPGIVVEAWLAGVGHGRAQLDHAAELTLRLEPGDAPPRASISGRVVDPDNAGVDGALVTSASSRALTDHQGRFTVDGLDPGAWDVTASAPGLIPATAPKIKTGTSDLVLTLVRGGRLRGVVRDANGRPATAFSILLWKELGAVQRDAAIRRAFFDGEGRFEIDALPAGSYRVTAVARDAAPAPEVRVRIDELAEIELRLGRAGRVRGRVVDGNTRQPIAGAQVQLEGALGGDDSPVPLLAGTLTGGDGEFALSGLGRGPFSLVSGAAGHHGRITSGITLDEGGEGAPLTIELTPTAPGEEPRMELVGIGATLSGQGDALVIVAVMPSGGAAEAGLGGGDQIVSIDGTAVTEIGFGAAIERIRGPEGSVVRLRVRRSGSESDVAVPRRRIRA